MMEYIARASRAPSTFTEIWHQIKIFGITTLRVTYPCWSSSTLPVPYSSDFFQLAEELNVTDEKVAEINEHIFTLNPQEAFRIYKCYVKSLQLMKLIFNLQKNMNSQVAEDLSLELRCNMKKDKSQLRHVTTDTLKLKI